MFARMHTGVASPRAQRNADAPYSDSDWVARIRESDRAAFEALVRHYADRLCAFDVRHDIVDEHRTAGFEAAGPADELIDRRVEIGRASCRERV